MNKIQLCELLKVTTYSVEILCGDEVVDGGSAVAFNPNGCLLTAAHVVARLSHLQKDLSDSRIKIIAKTSSSSHYRIYKVGPCAPSIYLPEYLQKPLIIDLAILLPDESIQECPFLGIRKTGVMVGENVLMAGFPDELELPLSFDRNLDMRRPEAQRTIQNIVLTKRLLMIKSGMIGHKSNFNFYGNPGGITLKGETFYIDNAMHSGASGGPVIDESGMIAGIITQRAITNVPYEDTPNLRVPSGSCLAITPNSILQFLK